jgi:hypothetical protein
MEFADAMVERLGVSGIHPDVRAAAAAVGAALDFRDIQAVRFACGEFAVAVHRVAMVVGLRGRGFDRRP